MLYTRPICSLLTILKVLISLFLPTTYCLAHSTDADHGTTLKHDNFNFSLSGDLKESMAYNEIESDTAFFTTLRLQLQGKLTENLEITGRINTAKAYGYDFADDDYFVIDRLYFNLHNTGNNQFHLKGGRLPTMGDTSPSHLRLGLDNPSGALSSFTNIALDGVAVGYSYQKPFSGMFEFYYATQVDDGYEDDPVFVDTDIYGLKWSIFTNKTRSLSLQSFLFSNIWNVPEDIVFVNPIEYGVWLSDPSQYDPSITTKNLILDRTNLGDIYQTSVNYLHSFQKFDFFVNLGWSHTNAKALDELGTSLLGSFWNEAQDKDGYSAYFGGRYAFTSIYSKIGVELNYGSKYWINFSQESETAKLATRGTVLETYWTFEPPLPSVLSKWTKSLIGRVGYQHYEHKYTGSGFWLGEPLRIETLKNDPLSAQFYTPIDSEYKIYAAIEMYF